MYVIAIGQLLIFYKFITVLNGKTDGILILEDSIQWATSTVTIASDSRLPRTTLLRTCYDNVVACAILYAMVCWGCGSYERDWKRLNKLVRRANSVLDCPLNTTEEVGDRRMLAKLTSIVDNPSHPLHETVGALSSSYS